jgi:hypothetical protein
LNPKTPPPPRPATTQIKNYALPAGAAPGPPPNFDGVALSKTTRSSGLFQQNMTLAAWITQWVFDPTVPTPLLYARLDEQ